MAAIFTPTYNLPTETETGEWPPPRPHLRVLEGGRRPVSQMRWRRRRITALVATVVAVIAFVVASAVVFSVIDRASQPPSPAPIAATGAGDLVVVQSGDTLTSIAQDLQPTGDISGLVNRLADLHGPTPLRAGDRLAIGRLGLSEPAGG